MTDKPAASTTTLPSVERWERDSPGAATPRCPKCDTYLGVIPAWLSASGRPVWTCDYCGVVQ